MALLASRLSDVMESRAMGHGMRVALLAQALADPLGLTRRERTNLLFASLLHDAGLMATVATLVSHLPVGMAEKRWFAAHPLLAVGWRTEALQAFAPEQIPLPCQSAFESHPLAVAPLVAALGLSADVGEIIAACHERTDGAGYPRGLCGSAIPMASRILALADALDTWLGDINSATTRANLLARFFHPDSPACGGAFDPDVLAAARACWAPEPPRETQAAATLQAIYGQPAEQAFWQAIPARCYPQRCAPLPAPCLLSSAQALGRLSDGLLPLYFEAHSARVADLALAMARHLAIDEADCGALVLAGLLQNLGMVGVPIAVLARPQALSPPQRLAVNDHARFTGDLLRTVPGCQTLAVWAGEHHERLNGSGYYQGKKGRDISVAGRLLALADVFVALNSPRPYREAFAPHEALALIQQGRTRLFDPLLVGVLRQAVQEPAVSRT